MADEDIGHWTRLDGQVAIVTGAATGIGEGIAEVLAAAGAGVVIADLDRPGAEKVADRLAGQGHRAWAVEADVTEPESCRALVAQAVEVGGRVDTLVNNAGSYRGIAGSILDQDDESWVRGVEINFHSVFHASKPFAERVVAQGDGGAIVNIASVDGLVPCLGTAYDSAKAAVIHFTRSLALDLAPHAIRVNGIAPGYIDVDTLRRMRSGDLDPVWTPESETGLMGPITTQRSSNIPLRRAGTPTDIGATALFLASPMSAYVTGQTIAVDGGWTVV
jgi:NAD(P)-dependent dehydrogenase (short-subunit alcohol dehydrogenase family)